MDNITYLGKRLYPTPQERELERLRLINSNLQRELTKALEDRIRVCPDCRERWAVPE